MADHLFENLKALRALTGDAGLDLAPGTGDHGGSDEEAGITVATASGRRVPLHSRRNPIGEAGQQLDLALEGRPLPPVVALCCAGLGFVVDVLEERSPDVRIVLIEPDPLVARALLGRRDFRPLLASGRLTVLWGPEFRGASDAWRAFDAVDLAPLVLSNPVMARERPAAVKEARRLLDRLVRNGRENAVARRRFAAPYLLNTIRNVGFIADARDVRRAFGVFSGVPAIVVAAGPSLDANLQGIEEAAGRALVIAVDTALAPLLRAGIVPDLVVSVDPGAANAFDFVGLPPGLRTWLVTEGSVAPPVLALFRGRTLVFRVADHDPWRHLQRHGIDCAMLKAWSSVLVTALDLADRLGCSPIAVAGADLAYPRGRRYCSGVVVAPLAGPLDAKRLVEVDDVRGQPVESMHPYISARDWILTNVAGRRSEPLLNATGGGILHGPGIEQIGSRDLARRLAAGRRKDLALLSALPRLAGERAWLDAALPCARPAGDLPTAEPLASWLAGGLAVSAEAVRLAAMDALATRRGGGPWPADAGPVPPDPPLLAQTFSSPASRFTEEGSAVRAYGGGRWARLHFEVPGGRLRFDPATRPGFFEIGRIVVRGPDGARWSASTPAEFDTLSLGHDTYRVPHDRVLILFSPDEDPVVFLPDLGPAWNRPDVVLRVSVCLRCTAPTTPACLPAR